MIHYNVCTQKKITTSKGKETFTFNVGIIKVSKNGCWFLQLFQQPDTDFFIEDSRNHSLPVIQLEG